LVLSAPLIIALALFACSTKAVFAAELPNPEHSHGTHELLVLNGKRLRADIDAKYKELMSTKTFARENDVSSIVFKYVSPSTPVEDITVVLQSAGFAAPALLTNGNLWFLKNVGGIGPLSFIRCSVEIVPESPGDFHVIKDISGSIFGVDI